MTYSALAADAGAPEGAARGLGVGALVVGQSKIESEFPPSVRLTPATFPQGGRLLGCAF